MKFRHIKNITGTTLPEQSSNLIETAFFAAEIGGQAPNIDLHGLDKDEALALTLAFLHHEFIEPPDRRQVKIVKIKHGRGNGILRQTLIKYLSDKKQAPFIERFRDSEDIGQTNAVLWVALAPNKK